jgi:hypothetical protein
MLANFLFVLKAGFFVVSSGVVFAGWGRKHKVLVISSGIVALLSGVFLFHDVSSFVSHLRSQEAVIARQVQSLSTHADDPSANDAGSVTIAQNNGNCNNMTVHKVEQLIVQTIPQAATVRHLAPVQAGTADPSPRARPVRVTASNIGNVLLART